MNTSRTARASRRTTAAAGSRTLSRYLLFAEWRSHPARMGMAVLTIALGVALGFAVQLINSAAYSEFSAAARSLSGQADLEIRGAQATMDEHWYPHVAQMTDVAVASPVLELNATVPHRDSALKIIASDVFQASRVTPDLLGVPDPSRPMDTIADDTIFLSPAAQSWLNVRPGDHLSLQAGTQLVTFRIAGSLLQARPGQRLAVMDIATAQWRFGMPGRITRIDIKLRRGVDPADFQTQFAHLLQQQGADSAALLTTAPQDADSRTDRLSRAYRVNMNVLALVALFTGAFLVLSTQAAGVIRRRSQFALLRVLGWTRGQLLRHVLWEGLILGIVGGVAGLLIGYGLARGALSVFGSDLGGGYFAGVQPTVHVEPIASLVFLGLGIAVALLGSLAPALEAARAQPAGALKAGSEEPTLSRLSPPWPGVLCILLAVGLTQLPPLFEIPLPGYAAVALLLIGGIALMPRVTGWIFSALSRRYAASAAAGGAAPSSGSGALSPPASSTAPRATARSASAYRPVITLSLARLANAPGQASIAMGGVLSSFALIVAMAVMVSSFRVSVEDWLTHLLSADLYASVATNGDTAGIGLADQAMITALPGIKHAAFTRMSSLTLDPKQPSIAILARPIDANDPGGDMQMTGPVLSGSALETAEGSGATRAIPIWVSEAMVDLYGYRLGTHWTLPLATLANGATAPVVVAGVWRDYVRQTGAIQMRLSDYRRLTHDDTVTEIAINLASGTSGPSRTSAASGASGAASNAGGAAAFGSSNGAAKPANNTPDAVIAALRALPFGAALHFSQPGEIRSRTLTIFDRSFAVTYLLEAVAILIGLFGVAATFSAQTLARAREFGMLRHVGVTRGQIMAMQASEGGLLTVLGISMGCLLGFAISLILVFVVNPQSFHWSMSLHIPWRALIVIALTMLLSSTLTAIVAGRKAVSVDAVRAVKEDW